MTPRALALAGALCEQIDKLGSGVVSLAIDARAGWRIIRVGAATGTDLLRLGDDLGLAPGRTGRWCRMLPGPAGALVLSASARGAAR